MNKNLKRMCVPFEMNSAFVFIKYTRRCLYFRLTRMQQSATPMKATCPRQEEEKPGACFIHSSYQKAFIALHTTVVQKHKHDKLQRVRITDPKKDHLCRMRLISVQRGPIIITGDSDSSSSLSLQCACFIFARPYVRYWP